jgi:hypothetical protein
LFWDIEVTDEDEEEIIMKIAHKVHDYGLDIAAVLMIETFKPLSYVGAQMGRFFVSPFLPAFGENIGMNGEKLFKIFEKRENVERLIKAVEDLNKQDKEIEKAKKAKRLEENTKKDTSETPEKKGWRRFLP